MTSDSAFAEARPTPRARLVVLAALFVLAAFVKVKYQIDYAEREPLADAPYGDSLVYLDEAARQFDSDAKEPYYKSPGYAALLAWTDAATSEGRVVLRVLQALLGLGTLYFVFQLAAARGGLAAGTIAFLLLLGYAPVTYHESKLLDTTASLFAVVYATWRLDRAVREGGAGATVSTGIAFGVAALIRGGNLYLAPLAFLVLLRARGRVSWFALLGMALPIAPIALHNHRACGEWILVNYSEGHTLVVGNNANATGMFALPPGYPEGVRDERAAEFELAKRALGRDPSPAEQRAHSIDTAWSFVREHPARAIDLLFDKARFLVDARVIGDNDSLARERERFGLLPGLPVAFPWLLVPALAMLVLRRARPVLPPALPLGYTVLLILATFVNERFRVGAAPFLCVLASLLPGAALRGFAGESPRRVSLALFLAGLPIVFAIAKPLPVTDEQFDHSERVFSVILDLHAANTIRAGGDIERAASVLGRGIADLGDVAESAAIDGALAELVRAAPESQRGVLARAALDAGRGHARVAAIVK